MTDTKPMQGLAAYLRCEAGGIFQGHPSHETLMTWAAEVEAATAPQPVQEPAIKQIAKEAQKHGLTLLKTADGFAFMKLGTVTAQAETAPQPVQSPPLTVENIRAVGGIVHGDGNIFFTNIEQANRALKGKP